MLGCVSVCWTLLETAKMFSNMSVLFAKHESSRHSASSTKLGIINLFSYTSACAVAFHFGFNLCFPNMQILSMLNTFSYACWLTCYPSIVFGGGSIQICRFIIKVFCLFLLSSKHSLCSAFKFSIIHMFCKDFLPALAYLLIFHQWLLKSKSFYFDEIQIINFFFLLFLFKKVLPYPMLLRFSPMLLSKKS